MRAAPWQTPLVNGNALALMRIEKQSISLLLRIFQVPLDTHNFELRASRKTDCITTSEIAGGKSSNFAQATSSSLWQGVWYLMNVATDLKRHSASPRSQDNSSGAKEVAQLGGDPRVLGFAP